MQAKIVVLAGDGIGPEVTNEAKKILDVVGRKFGHTFIYDHQLMGGCAIDAQGHQPARRDGDRRAAGRRGVARRGRRAKWDIPTADRSPGARAACHPQGAQPLSPTCARSSFKRN
jgi:3-isopropylmalate dehydrogenase